MHIVTATNETSNYGTALSQDPIWEPENLLALQKEAGEYGLRIYGIENFSPADWYDVLLDGPKKEKQMKRLKAIIRATGQAYELLDIISAWQGSGAIRRNMRPGAEPRAPVLMLLCWIYRRLSPTDRFGT